VKLSKLSYSFSQAKKNMIRNGLMSIASLFTISSCLIILGVFTVVTLNFNYITEQVKDQCEIEVFISLDAKEDRITEIGQEILAMSNVKSIEYISKEDALQNARDTYFEGYEELLDTEEGDDLLPASYKITLKDITRTGDTVLELEKLSNISSVQNRQDVVNKVISISNVVKRLSVVVMALLLIVAIVIMANTIKLTVFNRRKEINIMKYIGATDRFIRVPFVLEGIMIGLLGAVVSFGLISWGYIALGMFFESAELPLFEMLTYMQVAPAIGGSFLVVGCLIGVMGSAISMRKYLKV